MVTLYLKQLVIAVCSLHYTAQNGKSNRLGAGKAFRLNNLWWICHKDFLSQAVLLTCTSPGTSIQHDLGDSSPKSVLNYPVWLTASNNPHLHLLLKSQFLKKKQTNNPKTTKNSMMEEQTAPAQTAIKYLRLSCSARQLFSWLRSFLSLLQSEGLPLPIEIDRAISFMGSSLEQVLHWSNNLHIRWITCLLMIRLTHPDQKYSFSKLSLLMCSNLNKRVSQSGTFMSLSFSLKDKISLSHSSVNPDEWFWVLDCIPEFIRLDPGGWTLDPGQATRSPVHC